MARGGGLSHGSSGGYTHGRNDASCMNDIGLSRYIAKATTAGSLSCRIIGCGACVIDVATGVRVNVKLLHQMFLCCLISPRSFFMTGGLTSIHTTALAIRGTTGGGSLCTCFHTSCMRTQSHSTLPHTESVTDTTRNLVGLMPCTTVQSLLMRSDKR